MREGEVKVKAVNGAPGDAGFSLVEILVAMAILAGVAASIFTLYNMQHKAAHIEEDVVDVQQNLRMALHTITGDLRMAGFMAPGTNPIGSVSNGTGPNSADSITINTATASNTAARVNAEASAVVVASVPITLTVSSSREVDAFSLGDAVRIIDPSEGDQPVDTSYTVSAKDPTALTLTLLPSASGGAALFRRGSIIAKTGSSVPDAFPNTIEYCLGPSPSCAPAVTACPSATCVMRIVNGSAGNDSVMATNIRDLQFRYILDGSSAEADTPVDPALTRAVRITLAGETSRTAGLSGRPKSREITTIAKLRNR